MFFKISPFNIFYLSVDWYLHFSLNYFIFIIENEDNHCFNINVHYSTCFMFLWNASTFLLNIVVLE